MRRAALSRRHVPRDCLHQTPRRLGERWPCASMRMVLAIVFFHFLAPHNRPSACSHERTSTCGRNMVAILETRKLCLELQQFCLQYPFAFCLLFGLLLQPPHLLCFSKPTPSRA